jgi:hypothetical protein
MHSPALMGKYIQCALLLLGMSRLDDLDDLSNLSKINASQWKATE